METKINRTDETNFEFEAIINKEELSERYSVELENIRKQADIKGFRKGKVPLAMVEKLYSKDLLHDIAVDSIQEIFQKYIEDEDIRLASKPTLVDFNNIGDKITIKIQCYHFSKFDMIDLKNISIDEPNFVVDETDIDDNIYYIEHLLGEKEETETVESKSYELEVTVENYNNDGLLINEKPQVGKLLLYENGLEPDFVSECIGKKKSDTFKFQNRISKEQGNNEYIMVNIQNVWKVTPKQLDEELIEQVSDGRFTSMEDLREDVALALQDYLNQYQEKSRTRLAQQKIIDAYQDMKFPEVIFEQALIEYFNRNKDNYASLEEMKQNTQLIDDFKQTVANSFIWDMVVAKIIETNEMAVEIEDVEELFSKYNLPAELATMEMFEKIDKEGKATEEILTNKVLEFIKSEVTTNTFEPDPIERKMIVSNIKYSTNYIREFIEKSKSDIIDDDIDDNEHICGDDCDHE